MSLCLNIAAYAFAELIDNSLAATRNNDGPRNIELRLVSDSDLTLPLNTMLFINVAMK